MSLSEEDAQAVLDQMKAEDEAESQKAEEHKSSIVAIDLDASADVPQPLESLGVSDLPLPTARKRAKSVSEEIAAAVVAARRRGAADPRRRARVARRAARGELGRSASATASSTTRSASASSRSCARSCCRRCTAGGRPTCGGRR